MRLGGIRIRNAGWGIAIVVALLSVSALVIATTGASGLGKYFGRTVSEQSGVRAPRSGLDSLYESGEVDLPISDRDTTESVISISQDFEIEDLNVLVNVTHTWVRDLKIVLFAPNDTLGITLLNLFPGDSAVNMIDCWFDDEAPCSIVDTCAHPPFTGYWVPSDSDRSLSDYDGMSTLGEWSIQVIDQFLFDTGILESWAIEVNAPTDLSGTTRDAVTEAVISNVLVELLPTPLTSVSTLAGLYTFDRLNAGTYSLRFTKEYYDPLTIPDVVIDPSVSTVVNANLNPVASFFDFRSTLPPAEISDFDPAGDSLELNIRANVTITDLDVTVNITHTYIGDLDVLLVAPFDTVIRLVPIALNNCNNHGEDLRGCRFDDEAGEDFPGPAPNEWLGPMTGIWRPDGDLSEFDNQSVNGSWFLKVIDRCELDVGTIDSFTIHVTQSLPTPERPSGRPIPEELVFHGGFPNPFNPSTELRFELGRSERVALAIYDLQGRLVETLLDRKLSAGSHTAAFNANGLASGIYFARLSTADASRTQKIILLR